MHVLGIQMMYCARFHGPDHFSRFAHVHEERGKGREGKDIIPIYVVHETNVHMNLFSYFWNIYSCMYSLHIIPHTRRGDLLCHWLLRGVMLM